jgi:hypothetical protein
MNPPSPRLYVTLFKKLNQLLYCEGWLAPEIIITKVRMTKTAMKMKVYFFELFKQLKTRQLK